MEETTSEFVSLMLSTLHDLRLEVKGIEWPLATVVDDGDSRRRLQALKALHMHLDGVQVQVPLGCTGIPNDRSLAIISLDTTCQLSNPTNRRANVGRAAGHHALANTERLGNVCLGPDAGMIDVRRYIECRGQRHSERPPSAPAGVHGIAEGQG